MPFLAHILMNYGQISIVQSRKCLMQPFIVLCLRLSINKECHLSGILLHSIKQLRHSLLKILTTTGQPHRRAIICITSWRTFERCKQFAVIRQINHPKFKSILLNYFAPDRRLKLWSVAGKGKFSRLTLSFKRVKLTQILILSSGFGTTTIPTHQSVGWSTRKITPFLSMFCSSCFTLGNNGMRGTGSAYLSVSEGYMVVPLHQP